MDVFEKALGNWIQIIDGKNEITLDDYGYDTGVIEGTTGNHCVKCVAVNRCWFKNENGKKPETMHYSFENITQSLSNGLSPGLYHYRCHCKETPIFPNGIEDIQLILPAGKLAYLFASKSGWIDAMGYHEDQYMFFVEVLLQKTKEAYYYGKYVIQNITRYGCKINVLIDIPGVNEKQGKTYKVKTNYMVFPDGRIKNEHTHRRLARMKLLDDVRVINDNYLDQGIRKGMVGTIIEAEIRWDSFFVNFQDQRVYDKAFMSKEENVFRLKDDVCLGIKIKDLELVKDNQCDDEMIRKSLPESYKDQWCKVENGYIVNLSGKRKNRIAYNYNS